MFKGGAKKNSLDGRTPQSFFFWYNDLLLLIFGLNLHVEKKRTHERHFCFTFASQSVLSCTNFLYWQWVTKIHCCVSVFTVKPSIIKKMQTSQYRKSRIWKMKNRWLEIYKKPRQESGLCDISYARYSEKKYTQIYKALAPGNPQKHLSLSFPSYGWIPCLRISKERLKLYLFGDKE